MTNANNATLYINGHHGIYVPQAFATMLNSWNWRHIGEHDQIAILKVGPEHLEYWDVWQEILDYGETEEGYTLHQTEEGDVWIVDLEGAINVVNDAVSANLEYVTTHYDSGEHYAECMKDGLQMCELQHNVKFDDRGLTEDEVWDVFYDLAAVAPSSIYALDSREGTIVTVTSRPIQEIEYDITHLGIDQLTLSLIENSIEGHMASSHEYVHTTTDCDWSLVIDFEVFQEALDELATQNAAA